MSVKTAGVGHFMIPTAPAAGTAVAQSASANTYGTKTNIGGTALGALYITGVYIEVIAGTNLPTYVGVQLYVTASTVIDTMNVPLGPTSGVASTQWAVYKPIFPPVPVAASTQILAATASSVASAISYLVTLECLLATNYVDDGVAVGTVTTVTNQLTAAQVATGIWQDTTAGDFTTALSVGKSVMNGVALGTGLTVAAVSGAVGSVTGLTASNLDATVSSRMATYTQPTGFLAASFPASVASPTNITAGVITTATNLMNAPPDSAGVTTLLVRAPAVLPVASDFTAARAAKLDNLDAAVSTRSTYAGGAVASVTGAVGSVTGNVGGNVVGSVASVTANVNADVKKINGTTVNGNGGVTPWGP